MTTGLLDRQRRFVDAYAAIRKGTAAAIQAGYSPRSAASTASRLLRQPEIRAALKRRIEPTTAPAPEQAMTPLEHLLRVMRDPEERSARRDRAAIAACRYVHPLAGAVLGKKAAKQEAAKAVGVGKFGARPAPPLALVRREPDKG